MSTTGFSFTHYAELQILNVLRGTAARVITGLTIALFTATPTDVAGTGTEVSGGGYARQTLTFNAPAANTSPTTGSTMTNSNDILFPAPTSDWGTITSVGIYDDAGNMWLYGSLSSPITILNGNPRLEIGIGQLADLLD